MTGQAMGFKLLFSGSKICVGCVVADITTDIIAGDAGSQS